MSAVKAMVPEAVNNGKDEVSLTLTWNGVTYDASGYIADLTITEEYGLMPKRTLTLVIDNPQMVASVRTKALPR